MENWLYNIREWWALNGRDVRRYGLCLIICLAGLSNGTWLTVFIGTFSALCMYCYDRFDGEYWRQRGAKVLGQDKDKTDSKP
jgi:hypothetical protein